MAFICNKILKCIRCDGPPRLRHFHSSVRTNIGWFSAISEACLCCKNAQPLRQRFAAFYNRERFLEAGKVLAVDINEGRLRILEEAAEQLGVSNIVSTLCCDLRNYTADVTGTADKVLLDAPCSGLGVLAKRADLRWRRTPEEILGLNDLQDQLLDSAAKLVKPGGVLVYSTCSIEPAENHERVAAFIDGHPEFVIESAEAFIPKELVSEEGYFASKPHKHLIDGAFAARLRKTQ